MGREETGEPTRDPTTGKMTPRREEVNERTWLMRLRGHKAVSLVTVGGLTWRLGEWHVWRKRVKSSSNVKREVGWDFSRRQIWQDPGIQCC